MNPLINLEQWKSGYNVLLVNYNVKFEE